MRKFGLVAFLTVGFAALAGSASAAPLGFNSCGPNGDIWQCDIYADYSSGASRLGTAEGNLGGYLVGYTFLLNLSANLSDGVQTDDVAHILVIYDSLFELFSNTVFNSGFGDMFNAALSGASIGGVSLADGQVAGCPPIDSGVPQLQGIGLCNTADLVTLFPNWADGFGGAGMDTLNIHSAFALPSDPTPLPEPGILGLLALGGCAAAASRRRRARAARP